MIVKCVRTKLNELPFKFRQHHDYYRSWLCGDENKAGFADLVAGREYVVYAIKETQGYPFYFIKNSNHPLGDYHLQPGPCFEIVEGTISKYWHYKSGVYVRGSGQEIFRSTLAIREWVDNPDFLYHLINRRNEEMEIWNEAAARIDEEARWAGNNIEVPEIAKASVKGDVVWQRIEIEADDVTNPEHRGEDIIRYESSKLRLHIYEDKQTRKRRHGKIMQRFPVQDE